MLHNLKKWLAVESEQEQTPDVELIQRAAAAVLFEIATVDQDHNEKEKQQIKHSIAEHFSLEETELEVMLEKAGDDHRESTSLYQFTRLINDNMDHMEKCQLLEAMWRVAFADGELDKYEEYMIRRLSELLHLAHGDFIRAKQKARSGTTS